MTDAGKGSRELRQSPQALTVMRTSRGYSKRQLARALGSTTTYISELESGSKSASTAFLDRLAEQLQCPVTMLLAASPMPVQTHRRRRT